MADEILSHAENLAYTETLNPSDFKIFVVDDTLANVMLLEMLLKRIGYNVIKTMESPTVHEMCLREKPDLILQDVMMPVKNGYEVVQELKADPETADIPVIFLTAFADKEHTLKGFAAGGNDYIAKPFEKEVLQARVNSQLRLMAARRLIVKRNEDLKNTLESRDRMYSVIAHDLRSPLGVVQMTLNMMSDIFPKEMIGEEGVSMLAECNKQVDDVFQLLDNLLKWTKSQTGALNVVRQVQPVAVLAEAMRDMFTKIAGTKGVLFAVDPYDDKLEVNSDMDMCQTILRNLLSNAIKFTEPGKQVRLIIKSDADYVIFCVADQGCGMTEEEVGRLFHKDTHFTKFGTAREEGSGLGLMISHQFAGLLGGKLAVQSAPGIGSTFAVYVPRR